MHKRYLLMFVIGFWLTGSPPAEGLPPGHGTLSGHDPAIQSGSPLSTFEKGGGQSPGSETARLLIESLGC